MPTNARITALLDERDHEHLIREFAHPDTPLPLCLRLILDDERWQGPVARAMALSRLIEGSYRPSGRVLELINEVTQDARRLLDDRDQGDHAVAIGAIAGALGAWEARLDLLGALDVRLPGVHDVGVSQRIQHALCAWTHEQLANDDPLEATPERVGVLWVLGRQGLALSQACDAPLALLAERLESHGAAHHARLGHLFISARDTRRRIDARRQGVLRVA